MRDVQDVLRRARRCRRASRSSTAACTRASSRPSRELLLVFFASVACVAALLLVEFGSVAAVVAIVIGSSLALSGSLVSLWVTGTALNVSSIVGMIMVVGIVAKNGILLLDFAGRDVRAHATIWRLR